MQTIVDVYGKALFVLIIGIALLFLVGIAVRGSSGLAGKAQAQITYIEGTNGKMADQIAMEQYAVRSLPKIIFVTQQAEELYAGKETMLLDYFQALDEDGKQISVVVYDVKNEQGESLKQQMDAVHSKITFEEAGIYTIYLKAADRWNATRYGKVKVPVNAAIDERGSA